MSTLALIDSLRARGVDLRLSKEGKHVLVPKSAKPEDVAIVKKERDWILMCLHHERGGDAPDPRLAFLVGGEKGLTRGAIETRLEIAFGTSKRMAHALVGTAMAEGYLVVGETLGTLYARGKTASGYVFTPAEKVSA